MPFRPGSYLVISHPASDIQATAATKAVRRYNKTVSGDPIQMPSLRKVLYRAMGAWRASPSRSSAAEPLPGQLVAAANHTL